MIGKYRIILPYSPIAILHAQGQKSNQVPMGLSARARFKYGRTESKILKSTQEVVIGFELKVDVLECFTKRFLEISVLFSPYFKKGTTVLEGLKFCLVCEIINNHLNIASTFGDAVE